MIAGRASKCALCPFVVQPNTDVIAKLGCGPFTYQWVHRPCAMQHLVTPLPPDPCAPAVGPTATSRVPRSEVLRTRLAATSASRHVRLLLAHGRARPHDASRAKQPPGMVPTAAACSPCDRSRHVDAAAAVGTLPSWLTLGEGAAAGGSPRPLAAYPSPSPLPARRRPNF